MTTNKSMWPAGQAGWLRRLTVVARVDVTPDEVNIAAGTFAKQQDQLVDV